MGGAPTAVADTFKSNNARLLTINPPGILLNDTDPKSLPLTVDLSTVPTTVSGSCAVACTASLAVNADGSFSGVASAPGTYTFTYNVLILNWCRGTAPATVTLIFPQGSGLTVNLVDQKHPTWSNLTDYRWIIEEDRTFWIDPKCQINGSGTNNGLKDSYGRNCPDLPVEALGYNFHSAGHAGRGDGLRRQIVV